MKEQAFQKLKPSLHKTLFAGEPITDLHDKELIDKLFNDIYKQQRQECQKSGNTIYGQIDMWFEAGRWVGVYAKEDVLPFTTMKFETLDMPLPNHYDKFLTAQYGDWLALPSKVSPKHTRF